MVWYFIGVYTIKLWEHYTATWGYEISLVFKNISLVRTTMQYPLLAGIQTIQGLNALMQLSLIESFHQYK